MSYLMLSEKNNRVMGVEMGRSVFLDTNVINSGKDYDRLFGGRAVLERVAKHYEIVIPEVVLDEVLQHKRKHFDEEKAGCCKVEFSN